MSRKLIIDGNAVYEIDETCMLKQRLDEKTDREKEKNGRKIRDRITRGARSRRTENNSGPSVWNC